MAFIRRYRREHIIDCFVLKQIAIRWVYDPYEGDIVDCEKPIPRDWGTLAQWVFIMGDHFFYKKSVHGGGDEKIVSHYHLG